MGNAALCTPSIASTSASKVVTFDGKLTLFTRSIRVADLMIQHPNHFLCDSSTLQVGQRVQGLATDEELEPRRLYFVIPMELLYSVLTYEEMSALTYKATKALKHGSGFNNLSRIFPVFTESCIFPGNHEGKRASEGTDGGNDDFVVFERYGKQRSWQPALETIVES
ncbi:hypothetical protein MLD38_028302 [Melastoma candidum]|uniref:Uncharacterized protein n=1 Tax=Melastoma candidum TaxID=119954 RepID=A0ACB9N0M2_9MYRT|nr:hypothetical protein MLD38_028302 [Melastoma candidum]